MQLIEFKVLTTKCCSLQNIPFKGEGPTLPIRNVNKFELPDVLRKRNDIIKPSIDKTCVFECIVMFKRLSMGDRYYYKSNTKAVETLVAKYDMYEVPLDQIDVIGVQDGLNINVFLYENDGWKNYRNKYQHKYEINVI